MPQDPNLYGQRPAKKQKKEIPLSSSLTFTSQLTSLLSAPSSTSAAPSSSGSSGRPRPSRNPKDDLFSVRAKRKAPPTTREPSDGASAKLTLKDPHGTEEDKQDLARTRRKMQEKARLYAAMKRGDYIAKEGEAAPLVDFDAKWAAAHPEDHAERYSSSGADDSEDDDGTAGKDEIVEYKDEYGRTRRGTRAEIARQQRREARKVLGAEELDAMSARPRAPQNLIFGDAIQSHAFNPEDAKWDQMEELAAKRDRNPTPPEDTHYDGNREIRTKGVGFYNFSRDKDERQDAMDSLARAREETERVRKQREEEKEKRRREIEERRRKIEEKRNQKSQKMADDFLQGFGVELATAGKTADEGKKGVDDDETK